MTNQRYSFDIPENLNQNLEEKMKEKGYQSKAAYLRNLIREDTGE